MAPHSGTDTPQAGGCPSVGTGCRLIAPHTPCPCAQPEFRTECSHQASYSPVPAPASVEPCACTVLRLCREARSIHNCTFLHLLSYRTVPFRANGIVHRQQLTDSNVLPLCAKHTEDTTAHSHNHARCRDGRDRSHLASNIMVSAMLQRVHLLMLHSARAWGHLLLSASCS